MLKYKLYERGFLSASSSVMGLKCLEQSQVHRRRSANMCGMDEKIYPENYHSYGDLSLWSFYITFDSISVNEIKVSPVMSGAS